MAISGILSSQNHYNQRASGLWPTVITPLFTVSGVTSSINEGSALTINLSGLNIVDGTYYWTIDTNAGDFGTSSGSFTVTSNAGSFTVTPTADTTTEGAETFTVSIRSGSTSGPILVTSSALTINDTSTTPIAGQAEYTTAGSFTWTAPAGVTSVCVVAIGGGSLGGGGLGWKNNIAVTPGTGYSVVVGAAATYATTAGSSSFTGNSGVSVSGYGAAGAGGGGGYSGDGGGNGGAGYVTGGAGGGAGGYSGNGGAGGSSGSAGTGGAGGGGGSGAGNFGGIGGGVGIYGQGTSGAATSGLGNGNTGSGGVGQQYGGGGYCDPSRTFYSGGRGAVRIIWGAGRSFPSTNTGNV